MDIAKTCNARNVAASLLVAGAALLLLLTGSRVAGALTETDCRNCHDGRNYDNSFVSEHHSRTPDKECIACHPFAWSSANNDFPQVTRDCLVCHAPHFLSTDAPHNETNSMTCGSCHDLPAWRETATEADGTVHNQVCWSCHSEQGGAPVADTHSSRALESEKYGQWSTQCVACHDPHRQQQQEWAATEADRFYLVRGTLGTISTDSQAGTTTFGYNTVTAREGWIDPADWGKKAGTDRGLILVPNLAEPEVTFEVNKADAATITVTGDLNTISRYRGKVLTGNSFGMYLGQLIKRQMTGQRNDRQIMLFNTTGPDSLAYNEEGTSMDPTPRGTCQTCHTTAGHWQASGYTDNHYNGQRCTSCHEHTKGFAPSCEACHGYPPTVNQAQAKDGLIVTPEPTGSTTLGAHKTHATATGYNYSCDTCHTQGMPNTPISGDYKLQMGFRLFSSVSVNGATYSGRDLSGTSYRYQGTNGTIIGNANGSMTCSNLYCHSDGKRVTLPGSFIETVSPGWAGSTTCISCHQYNNPSFPNTDSHYRHVAVLKYSCEMCHWEVTRDGKSINNRNLHVNGRYDVGAGPDTKWVYQNKPVDIKFNYTFAPGGGTCSANTCHVAISYSNPTKWRNELLTYDIKTSDLSCDSQNNVYTLKTEAFLPNSNNISARPEECKFEWGDGTVSEWGPCLNSHSYNAAGIYEMLWSARTKNGITIAAPNPRPKQVSVCNKLPEVNFTVIGTAAAGYDAVLTDLSLDNDYAAGTHNGTGKIQISWGGFAPGDTKKGITMADLPLTDTPSGKQFGFVYAHSGYAKIDIRVKDNAMTEQRPECWPGKSCVYMISNNGASQYGSCTVPSKPYYCQ